MVHLWFVSMQSFGAEALVPESATAVVKCLVAGGYDGDTGEQEVVERSFGASATWAVDLSHG